MSNLPLEGIRICDFSWVVVGPCVTQMLGAMGAEVIKVESGVHTDINRRNPPYLNGKFDIEGSGNFQRVNMNKKSCTLNLNRPEGAAIARRIAAVSDVVISNFRTGIMERFGLGYDTLRALKPDLVLVSSSGLGSAGPNRDFVCYNEEAYSFGGLGYLTGYPDKVPAIINDDFGDYITATQETFAVLAALYHRARTGEGQTLEMTMYEAVAAQVPEAIMDYSMNRRVRGRMGNHDTYMAPHACYPCKGDDQWVAIAVDTDEEWAAFCRVLGNPAWTREARFADRFNRLQNQEELDRLIAHWTLNYAPREVMALLQKAGVMAGPSLSTAEVVNDPHLAERDFFVTPDHPVSGKQRLAGMPWKSDTIQPVITPAPLLGQHNEYVFQQLLGIPDEEFARLVGEGIIA